MTLYLVTNLVNGKRYVGITKQSVDKRWSAHLREARYKDTRLICRAIRKYGAESFTVTVLGIARSWKKLCAMEQAAIVAYDTHARYGHGYNVTHGGDGTLGYVHTEATRSILAKKTREYLAMNGHPSKGKTNSLATRAKISKAVRASIKRQGTHWTGRKHTEEAKAKISAANKGKQGPNKGQRLGPLSLETRQKMSATRTGRPAPNKGMPRKLPASGRHAGSHPIELNGVCYISVMECHRQTGLSRPTLHSWLRKGIARYLED